MGYGDIIRANRKSRGLTQRELGDLVGCTDGYIAHLESELKVPSYNICVGIADAFGFAPREQEEFLEAVEAARASRASKRIRTRGAAVRSVLATRDAVPAAAASTVKVLDLESGSEGASFDAGGRRATAIARSADGRVIAVAYPDHPVRLFNPVGEVESTLEGHLDAVTCLAFAPATGVLATGAEDCTVRLWKDGAASRVMEGPAAVTALAWSPDASVLAVGYRDSSVRLYDPASGEAGPVSEGETPVTALGWSPDGAVLAAGSDDGTIRLLDGATVEELAVLKGHSSAITDVSFTPDASLMSSGSQDGTARLWSVRSGGVLWSLEHGDPVHAVTFLPDGVTVATAGGGKAKLWDTRSGKERRSVALGGSIGASAFSPDGETMVMIVGGRASVADDLSPEGIARDLAADPQLRNAYLDLKAAMGSGRLRETVVNTLRALAESGKGG